MDSILTNVMVNYSIQITGKFCAYAYSSPQAFPSPCLKRPGNKAIQAAAALRVESHLGGFPHACNIIHYNNIMHVTTYIKFYKISVCNTLPFHKSTFPRTLTLNGQLKM